MINFPILRTRRLQVQLKELSIGDSLALAAMPAHLDEGACTAFLRRAIGEVGKGDPDPSNWTVQERIMGVCHYLAATSEEGPDFVVGDGRFSDYLDGANDIPDDMFSVGEVAGDEWVIRHMTGAMAESIERLQGEVENVTGRVHWLIGGMAAQLVRAGEFPPDASLPSFDELLLERMRVFAAYPESDFGQLLIRYMQGREKLSHLFKIDFSQDGIVAMPVGGEAEKTLPPARFPAYSCISDLAWQLGGKS